MPAHWDSESEAWDTVVLGGLRLPGVAKVTIDRGRKLDKKSAPGRNGATITDGGGEGASVSIEIQMATAEEWDAWCAAMKMLDPTKTAPKAWAIVHPEAEAMQVVSVMIEKINGSPPDNGIKTVKLTCAEWFPKPKGKGKSKTTTPQKFAPPTVTDMVQDAKVRGRAALYDAQSGGQAGPPPPSLLGNTP